MGGLFSSNEYIPKYNPAEYNKQRPGQNVYGIDKKFVYWRGERVNNADGTTFKDYGDGYGKDKKHVFYKSYIMKKPDLDTFQGLTNDYAKDYKNVYYQDRILVGADVKTFKTNKDRTTIDKNFKYLYGKKTGKKLHRNSRTRRKYV